MLHDIVLPMLRMTFWIVGVDILGVDRDQPYCDQPATVEVMMGWCIVPQAIVYV